MFVIYSLTPSKGGTEYRLVEVYDTKADAELVLKSLESVNVYFNTYRIVEHRSEALVTQWKETSKEPSNFMLMQSPESPVMGMAVGTSPNLFIGATLK